LAHSRSNVKRKKEEEEEEEEAGAPQKSYHQQ
jgi:hypothetical protein